MQHLTALQGLIPAGSARYAVAVRGAEGTRIEPDIQIRAPTRLPEEPMGFRLRMTLAFAVLSAAGVALFMLLFLTGSYREFKADRVSSMERMTACLAGNIYWDMRTGNPQRVDEALLRFAHGVPSPVPPAVLVLGDGAGIVAATAGAEPPGPGPAVDGTRAGLEPITAALDDEDQAATTLETDHGFISAARIQRDGDLLGTVFVDYPLSSLDRHFRDLFQTAAATSLPLLPLLLLLGWLLGRRLSRPIDRLRACMQQVGAGDLDIRCEGVRSRDEIGALARGFEDMVAGLREKRLMEQEMVRNERLVAVGQLAAGVAHEINNPLGGMLNAVNTYRRHGAEQPQLAGRTLDLLERGLRQIQTTVSALLVQARVESHRLAPADLQDLHTLIGAEVRKKGLSLDWHCALDGPVPLPSSAVRQVLMNLLLNAIQAAPSGGRVGMECRPEGRHLLLRVFDDGPGIEPQDLERLFQPFYSGTGGHGLGLWVTYQTIGQLGGSIEAAAASPGSEPPGTLMEVRLPFLRADQQPRRAPEAPAEVQP
jgi:signal transduction histidine kinase